MAQNLTQRLLVVDDNEDAASVLSDLLQVLGYDVRTAGDADAAMAQLKEFQPQLALVDIGLPRIDGYQLVGMMRAAAPVLALVALTGYGAAQDRERALQAGFNEHLIKPVEVDRLTEVIMRLLGAAP